MQSTRLSERQSQIVEALRKQKAGEWIGRAALAQALGRNRLNQLDLESLAALEALGGIEVNREPDARLAGFVMKYRAKG